MSSTTTLTFYAGEDVTVLDQIFQADGVTPQNITGWGVQFAAHATAGPAVITKTTADGGVVITNGAGGLLTVTLNSADTAGLTPGNYQFSISRTDAGSDAVLTSGVLILTAR